MKSRNPFPFGWDRIITTGVILNDIEPIITGSVIGLQPFV